MTTITTSPFIGRKKELKQLQSLLQKSSASLIVLRGRRRIGKSRLIEESSEQFTHVHVFSGIPPTEKATIQDELHEFGWQLGKSLGEPAFKDNDWNDLFLRLRSVHAEKPLFFWMKYHGWDLKIPIFLETNNAWDLDLKKILT